nr:bifunctional adenosylcobinamide kinase/adenosylcobinamide-phosphate guanylyltransferase [Deltaproteobacteria bacterium]
MAGELILALGGARSGKSRFAAELAKQRGGKTAFIATATAEDEEMRQRIEKHRCCRPKEWVTIEEPKQVTKWLREQGTDYDAIIMDCLTLLLSNWLFEGVDDETILGEVQKLAEQA